MCFALKYSYLIKNIIFIQDGPSVLLAQTTTDTQWSSYTSPEQVELQCGFDGYPVPFVELSKDGKLIQTAISSLTYAFNAKSIDDFGFYACSARNKYGEANHFIEVAKLGEVTSGFVFLIALFVSMSIVFNFYCLVSFYL